MQKQNSFLERLYNTKLIIGMVHLHPLPGSPLYSGDMKKIIHLAKDDARALEDSGIDALIVENFGDIPFYPQNVPSETVAAMAVIVASVCDHVQIPVGVNVLRNDAIASLSICAATRAEFIRTNIHTGAILTDQGIIEGLAHKVLRHRANLGVNSAILADIDVKHGHLLANVKFNELISETDERGLADGLIVTGSMTGMEISLVDLHAARNCASDKPILIGSGVTIDNVTKCWRFADGIIVGTSLKQDGKTRNPVDPVRVKEFVNFTKKLG